MKPVMKRLLPPGIALVTAAYVGWPPAEPLDLGEDVVKAKSVRWRPDDLQPPASRTLSRDPLIPVLVAKSDAHADVKAPSTAPVDPSRPTIADVQTAITFHGVADLTGQRWAVLDSGPKQRGDRWPLSTHPEATCELAHIGDSQILVRCGELSVSIKKTSAPVMSSDISAEATPTAKTLLARPGLPKNPAIGDPVFQSEPPMAAEK